MTTSPAVIEAYKRGVSIHDLCDTFGVTRTEISLILKGVIRGDAHPCTFPEGCPHTVEYDDEPFCFAHSPDDGSSVAGYSWKATQPQWDSGLVLPHGTDIVTLSMQATLEIDVDLNSGQVVASRCWTPNVADLHGVASATNPPMVPEDVADAREAAAIDMADKAQWPDPTLHA